MKKLLVALLMVFGTVCYAVEERIIYQTWGKDAFKIYYVAGGTETAANYNVTADSISLIVAGGFQPGTTSFKLIGVADYDTVSEFKAWVELYDSSACADTNRRLAMQGQWVITIPNNAYEDLPMSALATVDPSVGCLTATNQQTLLVDVSSTSTFSRYIPGDLSGKRTKIKYVIAQFTGTSPIVTFYNSADTVMYPPVTLTSAQPEYFGALQGEYSSVIGESKERLEIRVTTTGTLSAGYMLINYTYE